MQESPQVSVPKNSRCYPQGHEWGCQQEQQPVFEDKGHAQDLLIALIHLS